MYLNFMDIVFIPFIVIAIFLRFFLIYKYKWTGKDSFYHFVCSEEFKNYRGIPKKIECFVFPEDYDYPPFLHFILSFFKREYHQKLQYSSPVIDICSASLIFLFTMYFFNINVAILAFTLYLITPSSLDSSFSLGPRSIGNFFLIFSILCFFIFLFYKLTLFLVFATFFFSLVLITHRLTTQSILIIYLALAITYLSIYPFIIILFSTFFAILITKGYYIKVLKGHFDFLIIFGKKILNSSSRKEMAQIFPNFKFVLFNFPFIIFIFIFFIYINNRNLVFFISWGLGLIILSILWIFGEGFRHMGNAIPPFSIIIAYWGFDQFPNFFFIFLLLCISTIFSIYKIYNMEKHPDMGNITTQDIIHGFTYIKENSQKNDRILCLPLDFGYNAAYFTNGTILQSGGGFAKGLSLNQNLHKEINKGRILSQIKKYKIEWIIVMYSYKETYIPYKLVYTNDSLKIFRN